MGCPGPEPRASLEQWGRNFRPRASCRQAPCSGLCPLPRAWTLRSLTVTQTGRLGTKKAQGLTKSEGFGCPGLCLQTAFPVDLTAPAPPQPGRGARRLPPTDPDPSGPDVSAERGTSRHTWDGAPCAGQRSLSNLSDENTAQWNVGEDLWGTCWLRAAGRHGDISSNPSEPSQTNPVLSRTAPMPRARVAEDTPAGHPWRPRRTGRGRFQVQPGGGRARGQEGERRGAPWTGTTRKAGGGVAQKHSGAPADGGKGLSWRKWEATGHAEQPSCCTGLGGQ